jgi:transposase
MIIIGADYHPGFQQIAFVDTDTGEFQERRLQHREEAEKFCRDLAAQGTQVRVGMEASGQARWFERLLSELHFELWIGDAAKIRTKRVRKQKTDRQDAQLILQLLLEDRFPKIWVPSWENRDLRQRLWHRHRMVQARTRMMNQLQAVALNEGLRFKRRLWREHGREQLEAFQSITWSSTAHNSDFRGRGRQFPIAKVERSEFFCDERTDGTVVVLGGGSSNIHVVAHERTSLLVRSNRNRCAA